MPNYIIYVKKLFCCERCGNTDPKYIGNINGKLYCRKCITFKGEEAIYKKSNEKDVKYYLNFTLSDEQKEISSRVKDNFINKKNSLIYAVTGAGKTEIVYEVISYALSKGGKVGFAIPRKDVVIELEPRLRKAFKNEKVVAVYGEHNKDLYGDITILTTHQLYRYKNYFDLLIVDEIDAFPYQNNDILHSFFLKSYRTNFVLMSATPSDEIIDYFNKNGCVLRLFKRFHNNPLIVPSIKKCSVSCQFALLFKILKRFKSENKPVLVFVPTIDLCKKVYKILHLFFKNIEFVHSKKENKEIIMNQFRLKEFFCLVTTTILERGITIDNLQVVVLFANHKVFNYQTLIQIAGRVGRNTKHPKGEVIFLTNEVNEDIKISIRKIQEFNKFL